MNVRVYLACGHTAVVTHTVGERIVKCSECELTSLVRAKSEHIISFTAEPVNEMFPESRGTEHDR